MADDAGRFVSQSTQQDLKVFRHSCLQKNSFFDGRDPLFVSRVINEATVEVFLPGEVIVKEGDAGDCMYFINHGIVEILVGPDEEKVAELRDGDMFGEMALMAGHKRTSTVKAKEFSDCRVVHHRPFMAILRRFPKDQEHFKAIVRDRWAKLQEVKPKEEAPRRRSRGATDLDANLRSLRLMDPNPRRSVLRTSMLGTEGKSEQLSRRASFAAPVSSSTGGVQSFLHNRGSMQAENEVRIFAQRQTDLQSGPVYASQHSFASDSDSDIDSPTLGPSEGGLGVSKGGGEMWGGECSGALRPETDNGANLPGRRGSALRAEQEDGVNLAGRRGSALRAEQEHGANQAGRRGSALRAEPENGANQTGRRGSALAGAGATQAGRTDSLVNAEAEAEPERVYLVTRTATEAQLEAEAKAEAAEAEKKMKLQIRPLCELAHSDSARRLATRTEFLPWTLEKRGKKGQPTGKPMPLLKPQLPWALVRPLQTKQTNELRILKKKASARTMEPIVPDAPQIPRPWTVSSDMQSWHARRARAYLGAQELPKSAPCPVLECTPVDLAGAILWEPCYAGSDGAAGALQSRILAPSEMPTRVRTAGSLDSQDFLGADLVRVRTAGSLDFEGLGIPSAETWAAELRQRNGWDGTMPSNEIADKVASEAKQDVAPIELPIERRIHTARESRPRISLIERATWRKRRFN